MYDSDLDFGLRGWDVYEDSLEYDPNLGYEYKDQEIELMIENDWGNKILKPVNHLNETFDSTLVDNVKTD